MEINLYRNKIRKLILLLLILLLIFHANNYTMAMWKDNPLDLTDEEKEYIRTRGTIVAATTDGVAPLNYINSNGDKRGITISVLKYIEKITGLDFECNFYGTVDEVFNSNSDIVIGVSPEYALPNMPLSNPYLEAETVLFMQAGLNPNELEDKIYAFIRGGKLPEGVNKDRIRAYSSREESLNAVEKGEADYGYGNEYSITFYNIQNSYKNIVTVPRGREIRRYSLGLIKEDPILLSIINKSIDSIDEKQMERFILEMATSIERKITPLMVIEAYGNIIIGLIIFIIGILTWGIIITIRHKKMVIQQNEKLIKKSEIDGLTGIYNTSTTKEYIIKRMNERNTFIQDALIILDCDKFKYLNDNYGHLAGDRALQYVAKILKSTFRHTDIIGRIGGDEFCVYIKDIPSVDFVNDKCKQVLDLMDKMDEKFQLTLSIGVKIINVYDEFKKLFHQADEAMYESKRKGGKAITIRL